MIFLYVFLLLSPVCAQLSVQEAATIIVPEPDTQICRSDEESAVFFIERAGVLESYAYGFIPPLASSCKVCTTGSQFNYLGINSGREVNISDIVIVAGQPSDAIIGMFACDNSAELCIEAVNNEMYTAASKDVVFYTTSYCQAGYCDAIILLSVNSSIKRSSDGEVYSYEDQTVLVNEDRKYKDASAHNYLRVRGFSCNSCSAPIPYCDKIDGRVETESTATSEPSTDSTGTPTSAPSPDPTGTPTPTPVPETSAPEGNIQADMPKIPGDFPKPSLLTNIEESGYSGNVEVPPSVITQVQADASTIDNYGMPSKV